MSSFTTIEGPALLPPSVLRNLSDKLYEKRKSAALEVEQVTKQLASSKEWHRISALVHMLVEDYALSPQANDRKGGLIGLAAATVALAGDAEEYLMQIVPPVLNSFTDQDCRVRYYACEALYNIAKVTRNRFICFFEDVFDALCRLTADTDPNVQNAAHLLDRLVKDIVTESSSFNIETFIPLLKERLTVLNPYVRQFLVGWIIVLDSVPDIGMLQFLPELLDGLLNMLSDPNREIRQQADFALLEFLQEIKTTSDVDVGRMSHILVARAASADEFTQLTVITWLHEFVALSGSKMLPYMADVLGVILPCLSHSEERIRQVALQTNENLLEFDAASPEIDIASLLVVVRKEMSSGQEATRLKALWWISSLLARSRSTALEVQGDLGVMGALLETFNDKSDQVVEQALEVLARLAQV
jgi:vacuole morphology and inheritance protein 14